MTTSDRPDPVYVWSWLPNAAEPVPTGVIEAVPAPAGYVLTFAYGRSYLGRDEAVPLYLPELPLRRGRIEPGPGLEIAGVLRDGGPDAWGQRVILRQLGGDPRTTDPGEVPLLTYLLRSGSDRPGALDFQISPSDYAPRSHDAPLADLLRAADDLQEGRALNAALGEALTAGSSAGGARPKATLVADGRHLIAKFSTPTDTYPVVRAEAAAMRLARLVGLDVADTELVEVGGRAVLLAERFDRPGGGTRRAFVSALTILGLHELAGRHATYHELADVIRARFVERKRTLRELYSRIVFNVLVGNTDDHARNHAAFWDGERLRLTPAYDVCPQARLGEEQAQAMAIAPDGGRLSQVAICLGAARHYELTERDARSIIDGQMRTITERWDEVADEVGLTGAERRELWGNQIINPFATYGYG
ncbi:MAG: HipA domain-containing protein [Actinomycetota bacterium]